MNASVETRKPAAVPTQPVVFERTYRATAQELWELWTTKDGFESWWGPEGFRSEIAKLEARLGGALEYDMIAATPETQAAMKQMGMPASTRSRGRFSAWQPHTRLALTHMIDFFKDVGPFENTIDVELAQSGATCRMKVTLQPMATQQLSQMQAQGMASQMTKLDKRFQQG